MKRQIIKAVSLIIAAAMLVIFLPGCSNDSVTVFVKATLSDEYCDFVAKRNPADSIPELARVVINGADPAGIEVTIDPVEGQEMNAIRALREACALAGISDVETDNNPISIKGYKRFQYNPTSDTPVEGYDETLSFYWTLKVNGQPAQGSASSVMLNNGDKLEFVFTYTGASGIEVGNK